MMSVWPVVLTVYTACCILVGTSQAQHALSVSLTVGDVQVHYNFNNNWFDRFYHCLRNQNYATCDAPIKNNGDVTIVRGCTSTFQNTGGFTCKATAGGIVCIRENSPTDTGCLLLYLIERNARLNQQARMTWVDVQDVEMSSNKNDIKITKLPNDTFEITTTTRETTQAVVGTQRPSPPNSSTPKAGITTGSPGTDKLKSDDGNDNNNLAIIIGAAAGGVVVIVIIVIIFWRCKKRTSSSSTTNNKEYEDTDIYPYGDSTLSNIEPNSNSINTNSNHKEPTPGMYAAVDPNKKVKKAKTSSDTNNADKNNENKSQQKKPRFNQNLDYTEVDIDSDADHYQSSSGVHDGQGVANRVMISPPAPPNPSAKSSYYNISSEAGKDPSATYSQVIKTNKTKDASTINGNGTGSNPTRDPSGYEEAVPRIDTQYTTVDPSENNTTIPAPDGVYAKLHDPVRNITDVYNEWPATDNAEK